VSDISSLENVHKIGLFGDYKNKDQKNLIKIKVIKNINLFQLVKYKNSKENLSNLNIDGIKLSDTLKTSINSSTRIIWMGPDNWYIYSNKDIGNDLKNFKQSDFAVTELSQSRSIIEIEGDMIYEVLKKGTPLNVNNLKEGDCANTIYNGITVTLDFISTNPNIIRIFGLRSFGESLYHSITDACLEFGYKTI
tara:strand:- start:12728 stop:13306 length:579 start_codon:yes stop_codon:yes gene_type:complete